MSALPIPWDRVFDYLADLADEKLNAAEYAMQVRKLYDVLIEPGGDPTEVREFLLFHIHLSPVSEQHRDLAVKLLPTPPRQRRGRPKGALGTKAYEARYQLYLDWIREKTLNPSLKKEQFVCKRLGITHEDLAGPYELDHRAKIQALLQDLKPARMKLLDEGQRTAAETIYPLLIQSLRIKLYREWCAANKAKPTLTKEQFVKRRLHITAKQLKAHPGAYDLIQEHIDYLDQGRTLSADSECG